METIAEPLSRTGKYLTFRVARHDFAMPVGAVRGLLPAREMERVGALSPALLRHFGPFTCGFASLRGTGFPVMDLRARLGLAHGSYGRQPCIVAVEVGSSIGPRLVGFIADRVSGTVRAGARDFSHGKLRVGGRMRDLFIPDDVFGFDPVPAAG